MAFKTLASFVSVLAALQVAFEFNFFTIVPESEEGITLEEISKQSGVDVGRARQVLRLLCTHRIFTEVAEGRFSQTANSAAFKRDENLRCAGHFGMDEIFRSAATTSDTIKASPEISSIENSPFKTALGAGMFEFYDNNPDKAARFAKAMAGVAGGT